MLFLNWKGFLVDAENQMKRRKIEIRKMRRFFFFAFAAILLIFPAFASGHFISARNLHRGMVGYGKTVFEGTKISTFKVVVLGVIPKFISGADLILVKVESPFLAKRGIGLVAGMSGSPVYFDGKLAGAIAYGWPFTKAAVAGVVPIHAMLTTNLPEKNLPLAYNGAYHLRKALRIGGKMVSTITADIPGGQNAESREDFNASPNSLSLVPLGGVLSASGFNAEGLETLGRIFPMDAIVPGGGKMTVKDPPPVEPGQSVGVALMEGDMNLVATGTLTYRSGSQVLAFGHPFLFLGNVDFPMVQTYVHYILPSLELPFKFASPIRPVGQIAQDRLYGIGGFLGKPASLIPINITVFDKRRRIKKEFHVRIIRSSVLTPRLATLAVSQAIPAVTKLLGGATASLAYTVQFQGYPPIRKKNLLFSQASISAITTLDVLAPIEKVLENNFKKVHLLKVNVRVNVKSGIREATLQKVVLDREEVRPGRFLGVRVWLKPYDQKVVEKKLRIKIPSDVQGMIQVGVAGGTANDLLKRNMNIPEASPLNIREIIHQIQKSPPFNSLIVRLGLPRGAINWEGKSYSNFPSPFAALLKTAGSENLVIHPDTLKEVYRMPYVILGNIIKHVMVEGSFQPKLKQPQIHILPVQPHPILSGTSQNGFRFLSSDLPAEADLSNKTGSEQTVKKKLSGISTQGEKKGIANPLPSLPMVNLQQPSNVMTLSFDRMQSWQNGILKHLAVSPDGNLLISPDLRTLAYFKQNNLFSLAWFNEAAYVGTANPGKIYKITKKKKVLFFDSRSIAILSLASLPNGDLLAGTMDGRLYWLSPHGKIIHDYQIPQKYIWDIIPYGNTVYFSAGNPEGALYTINRLDPEHPPILFARTAESHITVICPDAHGVYAGTANNGLLLRISRKGKVQTAADLNAQAVLSLVENSAGDLFIGVSGNGMVYKLKPDGVLRLLATLPSQDVTWLGIKRGTLLAGTGIPAALYSIRHNGAVSLLWNGALSLDSSLKIGLKGSGKGDDFVVSGISSRLFHFSDEEFNHGVFLSQVLNSGINSLWGRLIWYGKTPKGSDIVVRTRTGSTPIVNSSWSSWSPPYPSSGGKIVGNGRYLQFRISLAKASGGKSPLLSGVQIFWKPESVPPVVNLLLPKSGDVIDFKSMLRGTLQDSDGNTLLLQIWTQRNGKEKKVYSNLFSTPIKGAVPFIIPLNFIHQNGTLNLKLAISNAPSNLPTQVIIEKKVIKNLTFDSTIPQISVTKVDVQNGFLHVEGKAEDLGSYVRNVEIRMKGGAWFQAVPENGLFDSKKEKFYFNFLGIPVSNIKQIQVRAFNGAGNQSTVAKQIKVILAERG